MAVDVTFWGLHAVVKAFYTNQQGVRMALIMFDDGDTVSVSRERLGV